MHWLAVMLAVIGTDQAKAKDVLGRVYEYFLGKFAAAEGKLGGEFFTPSSVVRLLVEMIEPYEGRVYDPCCGSGGMFVQSVRFVEGMVRATFKAWFVDFEPVKAKAAGATCFPGMPDEGMRW